MENLMVNFVLEADIVVPRLESHRHRFVLDRETMERVIAAIPSTELGLTLNAEELRGLICNDGELANVLKLKGDVTTREYILKTVAAHAWLNDIPWTIIQTTDAGQDDPRFDRLVGAYMESGNAKVPS
jgi:hypothetical protein